MKKYCVAIAVAASAAAVLMLPHSVAIAKGPGPGMHSFHFKSHFLQHHRHDVRRNNNNALGWPLYGGLYATPPYDGDAVGEQAPPAVVVVRDYQVPRLVCEKHRETITVPSETGGTRDITITRC
jgi:hypothetical protein